MKKRRVLLLMHDYMVPPEDVSGHDLMSVLWKTEHDVMVTLHELGHDVHPVGVGDDLGSVPSTTTWSRTWNCCACRTPDAIPAA